MRDKDTSWLWVGAHAALATDSGIALPIIRSDGSHRGFNEHNARSVIATLAFCEADRWGEPLETPYTVEVDAWIWENWGMNPADLCPDYSVLREPSQEILGEIVGWIFQPPMKGWD